MASGFLFFSAFGRFGFGFVLQFFFFLTAYCTEFF